MIPPSTLRFIINRRQRDAAILLDAHQYASAVYMTGYALEVALKNKICRTFNFARGFPETSHDLSIYVLELRSKLVDKTHTSFGLTNIRQIRNHNLPLLLQHSGMEQQVRMEYLFDWNIVAGWNPEQRYQRLLTRKKNAIAFIKAAKRIITKLS